VRRIDDLHIDQHGLIELDWAFATTCHKAQGSEWEKVLIIDEGWPTNRADVQRWRYTAATRARSKLVIMDKWNLS
jgi:exodeoxyribonuclease-5